MNNNDNMNPDVYKSLSPKAKNLIEMYITARQFKNAILEEEIIMLPANQLFKDGTVFKFGPTKVTFRGNKNITRMYPYVVNVAFACEVYLKLLLTENDFDFSVLKNYEKHNISILYLKTNDTFKQVFYNVFNKKCGDQATKEYLENEIKDISKVFVRWRYIYEKVNEDNLVKYGFLTMFCDFLDRYCQKIIYKNYNYDVDKNMR